MDPDHRLVMPVLHKHLNLILFPGVDGKKWEKAGCGRSSREIPASATLSIHAHAQSKPRWACYQGKEGAEPACLLEAVFVREESVKEDPHCPVST